MRKIVFALALTVSMTAQADLVDLWTTNLNSPSSSVTSKFKNRCGLSGGAAESGAQVSCVQELTGRWFAENNTSAMSPILQSYKDADIRGRKAQEKAFIAHCYEVRQDPSMFSVEVGCAAILKGILDAGLPRDEFGIVGETAPPAASSATLGKAGGYEYTLGLTTVYKTGSIVTGEVTAYNEQGAKKQLKYGANCSESLITEDAGKDMHISSWSWSPPRFSVESEALKRLCS